jgi:hypothetical protein
MSNKRKLLYSAKLEGTNSDGEEDFLYYDVYEPIEGLHDVFNVDLPKKEQKWSRLVFPNFEKCTKQQNEEIYTREIRRIKHGVYFWNNGKLNYVTGTHYAAMVHWKLLESETDYFKYTRIQRDIFYFMDLCVKDPKSVGGIIFSLKRLGKSEMMQIEMFVDALLSEKGRYIFQALSDTEAKKNFEKTFYANRSLHESLPITKWDDTKKAIKNRNNDNLIVFSRETLTGGIKWTSIDNDATTDNIDFSVKPTKLSGIQGQKIKRASLDEFASLEKKDEMSLSAWHSKAYAQTTEDSGSKVVGKMWLIATAENIESDSLLEAQQIWDDSAPNTKDKNGFTPSGLKRMFIPFYLGGRGEDFLDEYGEPRIEKAIEFWENKMAGLTDKGKQLYSHQNPRDITHVFDIDTDGGLEADVIEIYKKRLKELQGTPQPKYNIFRDPKTKEIELRPLKEGEKEGDLTVELFELVQEHHVYRGGIDGTSTAMNSTNKTDSGKEKGKTKSKFSYVIRRTTGDDPYRDVANIFVRPEKRHMVEKGALWLSMYFNKHKGLKAYPERNASAGSTLTDLYEAEGQQSILIRELVRHNTDKLQEKSGNAYGIYIEGNNKDYRTSVKNKFGRIHGHKTNSIRLCEDQLIYGLKNSDLADADGVCNMACGNFDPESQTEKKKKETEVWFSYWDGAKWVWKKKEPKKDKEKPE